MDRGGAEVLYRTYGPVVFRRCLRLLRDPAEAQDAAQEVFVRALTHLDGLQYGSPLAWLHQIATRHCLNRLRDEARRTAARSRFAVASGPPNPADRFEDRDLARWIVDRFDDTTALIAVMHVLDGMTQEEVADAVGLSRRTVGTKLRTFLEQARRDAALVA